MNSQYIIVYSKVTVTDTDYQDHFELNRKSEIIVTAVSLKGPRNAVFVYKIAPNRFKTTYMSVLTFEQIKQYITHLFQTFFRASIKL